MDIKGAYQDKAEEIAIEEYKQDFYDLPQDIQLDVFNRAMEEVNERLMDQAENLRDRLEGR